MSSGPPRTNLRSTRGPLEPGVYWRRRLFVLGTVAALLFIAVDVVRGDEEPVPAPASASKVSSEPRQQAGAESDEASSQEETTGKQRGRKGRRNQNGSTPSPTPTPVLAMPSGPCAEEDVAVSPLVAGAVAGRPVTITLQIRTLASPACNWKLSADHLALKITRGDQQVWATWQCPRQVPDQLVVARRDVTTTVEFTWNARFSEAGCPQQMGWAPIGEYGVTAATFGGEPMDTTFDLAQRVVTRQG
ncbi:hypothetical protein [Nocardioides sp. R-C-SC26]|uniref:hypothetical protein n=1 Tax=Nocardioides sp. R-C-SC26 TaxID=2870414 RepID=UPI001E371E4D|nr:hypothetical protein [Nocardioides sp. R-C-SC26]